MDVMKSVFENLPVYFFLIIHTLVFFTGKYIGNFPPYCIKKKRHGKGTGQEARLQLNEVVLFIQCIYSNIMKNSLLQLLLP